MSPAEDFIYQFEGAQREVLLYLHELLTSELNLTDKIRYRIPFYDGRSWICYLNPTKTGKVELSFVRGKELSNAQGLLESKGRKQVSSVTFTSVREIPLEVLYEILQEAILLDETEAYRGPKSR